MPEIYVATDDLSDFLDPARTVVLAEERLRESVAEAGDGLFLTFGVHIDPNGDLRLSRNPTDKATAWERPGFLAANVLALVTRPSSPLSPDFLAKAYAPVSWPAVVSAGDGQQALAGLARILLRDAARVAGTLIAGQSALAEARRELETLHEAMASALQALGGRPLGDARLVLAASVAEDGPKLRVAPGAILRQRLGLPLQGLCSIGFHVARAECTDRSALKVRLRSAETDAIAGSWLVPGDALERGWLTLDLRAVIGSVLETAVLEIAVFLHGDETLVLSLDALECEDVMALAGAPGLAGDRALCMRLRKADYGRRHMLPDFWNWNELGLTGLAGLPHHISSASWSRAEVLQGEVELIAIGAEAPRPVARLAAGEKAVVRIPGVGLPDANVVEFGFTALRGADNELRVVTLLERPGVGDDGGADAPKWRSGSKRLTTNGEINIVAMRLPPQLERATVTATIEQIGGEGDTLVEWTSLAGVRLRESDLARLDPLDGDDDLETEEAAPMEPPDGIWRMAAKVAQPFAGVHVDHIFISDDDGYAHIDLIVFDLHTRTGDCPLVRFKFARSGARHHLEFRRDAGWPDPFEKWPEMQRDAFGVCFHISGNERDILWILESVSEKDRGVIQDLLNLLPQIVSAAMRDDKVSNEDPKTWIFAAQHFRNALGKVLLVD
jgi:hypothetical protein